MTTQAKIFTASLYEPSVLFNRLHRLYVGIGTIRFIFIQRQLQCDAFTVFFHCNQSRLVYS